MTSVSAKQFIVAMANRIVIVERADLIIDVLKQPRRPEREPGTARAPVAVADIMDDCESKNLITMDSFKWVHHRAQPGRSGYVLALSAIRATASDARRGRLEGPL